MKVEINLPDINWQFWKPEPKSGRPCDFCGKRCGTQAFSGLIPQTRNPAKTDRARACLRCYRKQHKQKYPGQKLPI